MPMLIACLNCRHHITAREQAAQILKEIIDNATVAPAKGGRTVMEVALNQRQVLTLCEWESACDDCEDSFDREEDRTAPWEEAV